MKLVIVDGSIGESGGHHLGYAAKLSRAAVERGLEVAVGINRRAPESVDPAFPGARTLRCMTHGFWDNTLLSGGTLLRATSCGRPPWAVDRRLTRTFQDDLITVMRLSKVSDGDLVLVPTAGPCEIESLLGLASKAELPRVVYAPLIRRPTTMSAGLAGCRGLIDSLRYRGVLAQWRASRWRRSVVLLTDSDWLSASMEAAHGVAVRVVPVPSDFTVGERDITRVGSGLNVTFLGDGRHERGLFMIPEVMVRCEAGRPQSLSVRFRIQVNDSPTKWPFSRAGAISQPRAPRIEIIRGPISDEAYRQEIIAADVLLLPYDPSRYRARTSQVLVDGLAAGVPAVVPARTWMADHCAAVSPYERWNPASVSAAVVEVLSEYERYRASALRVAEQRRSSATSDTVLSVILAAVHARSGNLQ